MVEPKQSMGAKYTVMQREISHFPPIHVAQFTRPQPDLLHLDHQQISKANLRGVVDYVLHGTNMSASSRVSLQKSSYLVVLQVNLRIRHVPAGTLGHMTTFQLRVLKSISGILPLGWLSSSEALRAPECHKRGANELRTRTGKNQTNTPSACSLAVPVGIVVGAVLLEERLGSDFAEE